MKNYCVKICGTRVHFLSSTKTTLCDFSARYFDTLLEAQEFADELNGTWNPIQPGRCWIGAEVSN